MGPSLVAEVTDLSLAEGGSRGEVVVRLTLEAMLAGADPRPDLDGRWCDGEPTAGVAASGGGTVNLLAPEGWWRAIEARAEERGESLSEAVRALCLAGLAILGGPPARETLEAAEAKALVILREADGPRSTRWLAGKLWGRTGAGRPAHRLLAGMESRGLVERSGDVEHVKWAARRKP